MWLVSQEPGATEPWLPRFGGLREFVVAGGLTAAHPATAALIIKMNIINNVVNCMRIVRSEYGVV